MVVLSHRLFGGRCVFNDSDESFSVDAARQEEKLSCSDGANETLSS